MTRKLITVTVCLFLLAGMVWQFQKNMEARRIARNQALLQAVSEGNLEEALALTQEGADVRTRAAQGESLLFAAVNARSPELLALLVQRGLPLREPDLMGLTVLHRAAQRGDLQMLTTLFDLGQTVDDLDSRGRSALVHALRGAHFEAAHLLLEQGAHVQAGPDREGPLISLLAGIPSGNTRGRPVRGPRGGSPSKSSKGTALQRFATDASLDKYRWQPLRTDLEDERWLACVRELLARGADPNAHDTQGRSAVEIALSRGCWKTARQLVEKNGEMAGFRRTLSATRRCGVGRYRCSQRTLPNPRSPVGRKRCRASASQLGR